MPMARLHLHMHALCWQHIIIPSEHTNIKWQRTQSDLFSSNTAHPQISVNRVRLVSNLTEVGLELEAVGGWRRQVRCCCGGDGWWFGGMSDFLLCWLFALPAQRNSGKQKQDTCLLGGNNRCNIRLSNATWNRKGGATNCSDECEGTSAISSILIILALGDVDSGDDLSSASLTTSWMMYSDPPGSTSVTDTFPLTSSISILLSGFWAALLWLLLLLFSRRDDSNKHTKLKWKDPDVQSTLMSLLPPAGQIRSKHVVNAEWPIR